MAQGRQSPSQGWKTLLCNHADGIASIDLTPADSGLRLDCMDIVESELHRRFRIFDFDPSLDGPDNAGTDCNRSTLFRRTRVRLRNGMTPAAKCERLATMLYAKADREREPEIPAEWKCIARGYLILANQFERNGSKDISYASFARIRDIDEEVA
jgi:hypothetical protein